MDKKSKLSAIILVAGYGKRISNYTIKPKCLLKFGNYTILQRNIKFLINLGIKKITIVVGYKSKDVIKNIKSYLSEYKDNIKIIENKKYLTHGNCYSLYLGLKNSNTDVIYFDGDLVYKKSILQNYLNHKSKNSILVGKGNDNDIECAKIFTSNNVVKRVIEKKLFKNNKYKFLGESLGINKMEKKNIKFFIKIAKEKFKIKKNLNLNWDTFYDQFILKKFKINYFFIKSNKWIEIDTHQDYINALKMFRFK